MPFANLKKKKVLVAVIILSFCLVIATIIVHAKGNVVIDRIFTTEGSFEYSINPNRPFLYYEIRVETGETINFSEILFNESLPIPSEWGVEVTVYDENGENIHGNRINDILIYHCTTKNVSFTAYQISYLLVQFTIEVEAFYYETMPIVLYLLLSLVFIWINFLTYVLVKRRKETEKWFKPFRK
jgi:hypothetical protein